jgi:hypothetical protein
LRFSIDGLKSAMGKSNCECRQLFRVLKPIGTMIGMIGALGWLDVREVRLRNNGSVREFVKVLNWRGFLKPETAGFRGWVLQPWAVGMAT